MRAWALLLVLSAAALPDTIRITSNLVLVHVSVLDSRDHPVTTLAREQFRVLDNGHEQDISYFSHEDAPISVAIILDSSGSMKPYWNNARQMLGAFCESLDPRDEVALLAVGQRARVVSGFTRDCNELQNRLIETVPNGLTPLLDAFPLAFQQLRNAHAPRRAVLVISDGGENSSRFHLSEIRSRAREANAQIYSGTLGTAGSLDGVNPGLLSDLSDLTGGRSVSIDRRHYIAESAASLAQEIHDQYVLGFHAPTSIGDGKFHRITVKVDRGKGPRLSLFYRSSYRDLPTLP